ncbi:T9SS type B sorting domain-containing protein [Pelagihabitans pacificus]|nr:T9SS type B sorting domain-containing protein [Pelagihabitans pacificus]
MVLLFLVPLQFALGQALDCTQLLSPANGDTNVPLTPTFEWNQASGATGYLLNVGTTQGGVEIFNERDLGNVVSFEFPQQLPPQSDIYVSIIPYNDTNRNDTCAEIFFTTAPRTVPSCTEIINPTDGDALVSVSANITWIRDFNANGYLMTIYEGDPNGILIWDKVDVGNGTNAQPPEFKPRTRYYVTIIPYNEFGEAPGCQPITFTTGDGLPPPDCAELILPESGSTEVPVDTNLAWAEVPGAESYILSVGTRPAGTDIVDNRDMGLSTTFELPNDLPQGTRIYVQIRTSEGLRESESCTPLFFDTFKPTTTALENSIPRFFTPNSDGTNDVWSVDSVEDLIVESVYIFDRYGKMLKQLAPGEGWNGTFNGRALPSGSYWYAVSVENYPKLKGHFLLKR